MAEACAGDQGRAAGVLPAAFGFRSLLTGAQNLAAGFIKDPTTAVKSMRGVATAVKSSARAWGRGAASNNCHGYAEGRDRVERIARTARGTDRLMMLRRWIAALRELAPDSDPSTPPAAAGSEWDDEWQQLASSLMLDSQGDESQLAAVGTIVFADEGAPNAPHMNFREVFLRSRALELLVEGFIKHPSGADDEKLLTHLLHATLHRGQQVARPLAAAISSFANVYSEAARATVVVPASDLATTVAEAVALLKVNAEAEILGRTIKEVQQEVEARLQLALMVAPSAVADAGATSPRRNGPLPTCRRRLHPQTDESNHLRAEAAPHTHAPRGESLAAAGGTSGDGALAPVIPAGGSLQSTSHELQASVIAMQHLWCLSCQLAEMTARRNQLAEQQPAVPVLVVIARVKAATAEVTDGIGDIVHAQHELAQKCNRSAAQRDERMQELAHQRDSVTAELEDLSQQRSELLRQLAVVDERLNAASSKLVELEEERSMFDEGVQVAIDVMHQEEAALSERVAVHHAELDALNASADILNHVKAGCTGAWEDTDERSRASTAAARQHWLASAELLGLRLHELARLLLQQMRFCFVELEASDARIEALQALDMLEDTSDAQVSRQRFLAKYLETEARLRDVRRSAQNLSAALYFSPYRATSSSGGGRSAPADGEGAAGQGRASEKSGLPDSLLAILASLKDMEREASALPLPPGSKRSFDGDEASSEGSTCEFRHRISAVLDPAPAEELDRATPDHEQSATLACAVETRLDDAANADTADVPPSWSAERAGADADKPAACRAGATDLPDCGEAQTPRADDAHGDGLPETPAPCCWRADDASAQPATRDGDVGALAVCEAADPEPGCKADVGVDVDHGPGTGLAVDESGGMEPQATELADAQPCQP